MRLSPDQVRFVESLFARLREERLASSPDRAVCEYDGGKDLAPISALSALTREDFLNVVERGCRDAEKAAKDARALTTWAIRLIPYLERDRTLTVEQAVDAYVRDRQTLEAADDRRS